MTLFSRDITVDIAEGGNGNLIVTSRMADVFHDIAVTLDVSLSDLTILDARVEMAKVPSQDCYLICPVAKKLIGLNIAKGFNRRVVSILAGVTGCPNILNLVLVGAPLAINAAHLRRPQDRYLKGICVAHP